jgi:hypothetical protein
VKELVDYLVSQGCPEALAFKDFVEGIKRQCRQVVELNDGRTILIDEREKVDNE